MAAEPRPNITPQRRAKRAILKTPEVLALLDSIWDGELIIQIEKVKGTLKVVSIELREDDLVEEILKIA